MAYRKSRKGFVKSRRRRGYHGKRRRRGVGALRIGYRM